MSCFDTGALLENGTQPLNSHCLNCKSADPLVCDTCESGFDIVLDTATQIWRCTQPLNHNLTTTTPQCTELNCRPCEYRCWNNVCEAHPDNGSFYYPMTQTWCGSLTVSGSSTTEDNVPSLTPFIILLAFAFLMFMVIYYYMRVKEDDSDSEDSDSNDDAEKAPSNVRSSDESGTGSSSQADKAEDPMLYE